MKRETIKIVDFSSDLSPHFERLNYQWLKRFFEIEPIDVQLLANPQESIIAKGGHIFFAKSGGEVMGTVALLKIDKETFELGKMGVEETFRGQGIGTILLEYCLQFCRTRPIKTLVLYSAKKLESAIHLYKKYGFKEVDFEPGDYKRTDIKMELKF